MNDIVRVDQQLLKSVRNVLDFPRPGINFKDIAPVLADPELCEAILNEMLAQVRHLEFDAVAGIESRGFIFGMLLARSLFLPFVPIRKKGKLPFETIHQDYDLEYGTSSLEMHKDALAPGARVLLHDDLLATGGTVEASCKLLTQLGAKAEACCFILRLSFLDGTNRVAPYCNKIYSLLDFNS